ncbi:uncharacterized protein LOC119651808 isoform X2 [Hermetia illucens]|uniref:uncharacterized protein LOC119651808 isoform X2 n=1 Tax=Hermetia illucens TaxID=343691 RepID=UPI0018CC5D5A|nr:uncharacterized protein LOC119651808 isoform X2 [Hermetia illucens]
MNTQEKFEKILESFLHKNYRTTNDVYMELLLSHLSGKLGKGHNALLKSPFVLVWLEKCLTVLETDSSQLRTEVIAFMLRLSALVVENEWLLAPIREKRIFLRIHDFLCSKEGTMPPMVKFGHVQFLASANKYSLGLGWMKQTGSWRSLISYCQRNQTLYVVREAEKLLYDILYNYSVNLDDEEQCIEMLNEIMKPLMESVFSEDAVTIYVDDTELQQKLTPTLHLISFILLKCIESEVKTKIAHYLQKTFNLNLNLWKLASMTQNEQFMLKIFKTYAFLNYAQLLYDKWTGGQIPPAEFNRFGMNFFNVMKFCISRKSCINVLKLAEINHKLWIKLGPRAPNEIIIENECIKFENQLIMYHVIPVLFTFRYHRRLEEELFDNYMMKLLSISCEFTLRACYSYRDTFYEQIDKVPEYAYKSIHGILSLGELLHQDRAILIFQTMAYALKEFATDGTVHAHPKADTDLLVKMPNLLSAVLVGLEALIHRYNITWKESLESTYLLHFTMALLNNPNITQILTVQALKLTQTCIEHFLSPNLALLVDNFQGSALQHLGPIMMKRLHDNSWEVRDSTVELVTSMTCISCLKFPAFQEYILDSGICPVIWSMAKNDLEPYVRASALKCLNQMTQINLIWENCLSQYDIMDHLLKVSCVEPEGIVRKEAVLLVTRIFSKRKVAPHHLDLLFSTMVHCTVIDLHWEVKYNGLVFWKVMIYAGFENQGMIDGTFPSVTFSKEKKKIITLTQKEILLRIEKILTECADRGCLGVIMACLNDTCDLEVSKRAIAIAKRFQGFLIRYEFTDYFLEKNVQVAGINTMSSLDGRENTLTNNQIATKRENISEDVNMAQDQIIESIISAQDINLLSEAYEKQMQMGDECPGDEIHIDPNLYRAYAQVRPIDFVRALKVMDLDALINERTDWIAKNESFDSLLDDMIFSIQTLDVNAADCY